MRMRSAWCKQVLASMNRQSSKAIDDPNQTHGVGVESVITAITHMELPCQITATKLHPVQFIGTAHLALFPGIGVVCVVCTQVKWLPRPINQRSMR